MKSHLTFLFLFLIFLTTACNGQKPWGTVKGEGDVVQKTINVSEFNGVHLTISGDIILKQGPQHVEISAQPNLIDHLKTEVKNGVWHVGFDKNIRTSKDIKFFVTVPDLTEVSLSGSGAIRSDGTFRNINDLSIRLSGSGEIDFETEASTLSVEISGSGEVELAGRSGMTEIAIGGSGDVDAYELHSGQVKVRISGSGDVRVYAEDSLEAKISGSGDVHYRGNPRVQAKVSGSGEVMSEEM